MQINRKALSGTALAVLAVLFVAVMLLVNVIFRGARADLTRKAQIRPVRAARATRARLLLERVRSEDSCLRSTSEHVLARDDPRPAHPS